MAGHCGVRHLGRCDEVDPAHVGRVEPEPRRDQVHQPLVRQHRGDHADAAVRSFRALVGRDRVGLVLVVADVVRAGHQACARHRVEQRAERPDAVRADAGVNGRAQPENPSILADRRRKPDPLVPRVACGLHVLRARLHPLHRCIHPQRDPREEHLLRVDLGLDAEASADVGRDDPDPGSVHRQAFGHRFRDQVRDLGRGPQGDARAVWRGHHAAALDGGRRDARVDGLCFDHEVGAIERGADIAPTALAEVVEVARDVIVNERGALAERRVAVHDRGQHFDVGLHALRGVSRFVPAALDHGRDHLAHEADTVPGQDRPGRREGAGRGQVHRQRPARAFEVGRGERRRDAFDPAACNRASHERDVQASLGLKVVDKTAFTA